LEWKGWHFTRDDSITAESFLTPPPPDPNAINFLNQQNELMNFVVNPTNYSDFQTQSRSAQDAVFRFEGLSDGAQYLMESISEMLNNCAQSWLEDVKDKMPEKFALPIFDEKTEEVARKNITKEQLKGQWLFKRSNRSIEENNRAIEKAQLGEFIQALNTISGIEKPRWNETQMLKYICSLWNVDPKRVLDDKAYAKKMEEQAVVSAEAQKAANDILQPQQETPQGMPQEQQGLTPQDIPGELGAMLGGAMA